MNVMLSLNIIICVVLTLIQENLSQQTEYQENPFEKDRTEKCSDVPLPNIINGYIKRFTDEAEVTCNTGFKLIGSSKVICKYNQWNPIPRCVQEVDHDHSIGFSCSKPVFSHATVDVFPDFMGAIVNCQRGYYVRDLPSLSEFQIKCSNGEWMYENSRSLTHTLPECIKNQEYLLCINTPQIPNAIIISGYSDRYPQVYTNGEKIKYQCESGFVLQNSEENTLTCSNGHWLGNWPSCVAVGCKKPDVIRNGRWHIKHLPWDSSSDIQGFPPGTQILFECYSGYDMVGPQTIVCLSTLQWSRHVPKCGVGLSYCPSLAVPNAKCTCNSMELSYCEPFYTDMEVECKCDHGYKLIGSELLRCTADKTWNFNIPTCIEEAGFNDLYGDGVKDRTEDGNKSDIIANGSDGTHMNTLAIVIATACSVLGVLLFIMVIMVFRRRKPRPRLYHQVGGAPPPYTRVHSGLDEHDRVALIGYETGARLPTYEEAIRNGSRIHRSDIRVSNDYRPLPHIPGSVRGSVHPNGPPHSPQQHHSDSNRHSIITTSTINRDALSEMFGSIDTVNVSMSDASTSVTVETLDSGTSRPSNGSERATAGSLGSSQENFTTEDAPLLDNRDREEEQSLTEEVETKSEDESKEQQS